MSLALVMVGLPARGKTYTARKIARFLLWKGYRAKVFNVGNYRREQSGAQVPHEFFNPSNNHGMLARKKAAQDALEHRPQHLRPAQEGVGREGLLRQRARVKL